MSNDYFKDIRDIISSLQSLNKQEIESIRLEVDRIIRFNVIDEVVVSRAFDRMLSLEFICEKDIKDMYFKLLKYCDTFDENLSHDYLVFYCEKFGCEEEVKKL